jgi:hypothetical protein
MSSEEGDDLARLGQTWPDSKDNFVLGTQTNTVVLTVITTVPWKPLWKPQLLGRLFYFESGWS